MQWDRAGDGDLIDDLAVGIGGGDFCARAQLVLDGVEVELTAVLREGLAVAIVPLASLGGQLEAARQIDAAAGDAVAAGPGFDSAALEKWLDKPGTHFFCDTYAAAGPVSEGFFRRPNVHSPGVSAGRTRQAFVLLSQKVLANIETALGE